MMRHPIAEIDFSELSSDCFLSDYIVQNTPVLVRNLPTSRAVGADIFDVEALVEKYGERKINAAPQQPGKPDKWLEDVEEWDSTS